MQKEDFNYRCRELSAGLDFQLTKYVLDTVQEHRKSKSAGKLPVIWIETSDSGDNNIAFMNTTYPYLGQVLSGLIDLLYSNTFMAAQGKDALSILEQAAAELRGKFTLVVEGAIPLKDNGLYTVIARTETYRLTALDALTWLGPLAKYVVALGTCASFGGVSAGRPNVTGSVGVRDVLKREVINVSGCPVNPDWFVGTLAHLLLFGAPELDSLNRPALFYGFTVHRHCQRRSYFDQGHFAEKLGDLECMFSLGCVGPRTGADCPYRQWINHVNWPVRANTPCIGCTNEDFPDGSSPFFTPLPEKNPPPHEEQPAASKGGAKGE
ncbi:Periplasmic (NiFe) hydrogenase small subunit precursor [Pelotomaculum sp. FP]|uniref:hydrogenase small subunit n=1 Tax=Pelotomaculum sp. FP TaxID=261474 RepID=UPI0010653630|nr:hydrogenase small subunit [Pelotomaculum sp. FP]TEB17309.1 Periplasmic (NiFe) hydrogenase small subunit precursor [Pelotomaculum sp. FP]